MAKTTKQMSIHEIRLGKPKKNGEADIVKPGKPFDCPTDELDFLQEAGACRDLTEDEAARFGGKAADVDEDDGDDEAETARKALLEEAKGLGIKGLRANMSAEVLQGKIDEAKAAAAAEDDDDSSDDDGDDDDGNDEDVVG